MISLNDIHKLNVDIIKRNNYTDYFALDYDGDIVIHYGMQSKFDIHGSIITAWRDDIYFYECAVDMHSRVEPIVILQYNITADEYIAKAIEHLDYAIKEIEKYYAKYQCKMFDKLINEINNI